MTLQRPEFLTTALSRTGSRDIAVQDSIRQRMEDTMQKLLRGEVQAAEISPTGEPYARIEVSLPVDLQTLEHQPVLENLVRTEAERVKAAIKPILDRHCPGMVLEWASPRIAGGEKNAPAIGPFLLYGDKTIPTIATMAGVSKILSEKQAVLRQELNTALGSRQI